MKTFSSVLATTIRDYLTLKRALGREYEREEWVLARLDRFLAARHADLIAETFAAWCLTLQNLASGARRGQMRHVRNLCRSEEHTSELQSRLHLVCRLLLEKKKPHITQHHIE